MATDASTVPARSQIAPAPCAATGLVDERTPAGLVRAALEARRPRAPQDRSERAHEHPLRPVDPIPPDRVEGDDVSALWLCLQVRAHGQAPRNGIQLGELGPRELPAGGGRVGQPRQQRPQVVEPPALGARHRPRRLDDAVVDEIDECSILLFRNALIIVRPLHGQRSRLCSSSSSAAQPWPQRARPRRRSHRSCPSIRRPGSSGRTCTSGTSSTSTPGRERSTGTAATRHTTAIRARTRSSAPSERSESASQCSPPSTGS